MRTLYFSFVIIPALLMGFDVSSQGIGYWVRKADLGGVTRYQAVGFSIGGKGYLGTGEYNSGQGMNDLWEYDTTTNTWSQKANFGGTARTCAVGFSIGNKGYIGTGMSGLYLDHMEKDFWEYDPALNTWTKKADFGGGVRWYATGFGIGSKGYIGTGGSTQYGITVQKDLWEYDPVLNTWTKKADFPGVARWYAVGFGIGMKGYIGTGQDSNFTYQKDLWEYDQVSNLWTQKANLPGPARIGAVGFCMGSRGYIGTGFNDSWQYASDFWEFDPASDSWTAKADFGGAARVAAVGFGIGNRGFIGTGTSYPPLTDYKDLWEYFPSNLITDFSAPDTACVGDTIHITNLTNWGSTFYWNFCSGNINNDPTGVNIGNPGGLLNIPTYLTLVKQNDSCFEFISCQGVGVIRYYLGNSFSHYPLSGTNLGQFGLLSLTQEGIQVKKDNGAWYGFVNSDNTLIRLNFGSSPRNTPVATNLFPSSPPFVMAHGLAITKEGSNWVGFVTCSTGQKLMRLDFGTSLANIPTVIDFGNMGGILTGPAAISLVREDGLWYAMIMAGGNNLARITFGTSIFNTPTGVNLGNPGGFNSAGGLTLLRDCQSTTGYWTNYLLSGELGRLTFPTGITGTVTGTLLGNIGNLSRPHSFSEIFRQNDTLYAYITNRQDGTLTRLAFPPCNNASIPSSNLFNPPPFTYSTPGTYSIRLIVNEGLPDETVVCKQIVIAPKPQPALTGTVQVCLDSTGNVYTTQSGMTNYQWSLTGGIITGGGTTSDNTVTVTWNMAGLQQIRVNYSNSFGCSADSATVLHVTVHDLPVPSISGPSSVCLNSPGLLYATQPGMTNYSWQVSSGGMITSGGTSTDNTITITWTQTGMQSVSVNFKDTNGCTAASPLTFDITVHPLPVPALTGPVSVCRNSQGNMYKTQAGMTLYAWSVSPGGVITAGGSSADSTVTVTWTVAAAEYVSVNYTDSNGCTAVSPVVLPVLVNPLPVPSITGPTDVCINSPGNVYSTEPGMVNYIWSVYGSGTITGGGSTGDNTISITWTSPGPEIVSVSYTDTNHCSSLSPSNLSVWVKPLPDTAGMITGTNRVCAGSQGLLFTVMPVPNADYYVWSIPAGATIVSGQNTDSVIVDFSASALPGDFLVYGVNGCGNGFSSPAFHIAVKHPATVSAGPDTIACAGTIITVRHSSASDYTGLNWTTGGQGTLLNDTTLNPTYLPSSSDTGDVILSVRAYSDPPCPDDTSVMVIHYSQGPVVSTGPDMLTCIPFPVSITGASASHCSSVTWTTTGQGQISGVNSLNPVYTPVPADSGIVSLTLHGFGSAACPFIIVSDETRIMVYTALRTRSHKADTVAYEGIDTLFIPVAGGSGNYRYSWSPGASLLNDSVAKPVTTNLTYGLLFTLTVEDRLTGCTATDTLRVHVKAPLSDENCLVVHNVLTPNGDGINDKWIIDCIEQYEGNKVEIFNRWGSRVRIYTNYDNALQAWDGTDESDKPLPDGVYYYVITVPAQQVLTGWVLLRASSK